MQPGCAPWAEINSSGERSRVCLVTGWMKRTQMEGTVHVPHQVRNSQYILIVTLFHY